MFSSVTFATYSSIFIRLPEIVCAIVRLFVVAVVVRTGREMSVVTLFLPSPKPILAEFGKKS